MIKPDDVSIGLPKGLGIEDKSGVQRPRNEMGQEQFFELMVAQLQNQDPLNPANSNEFFSQIAQFSTVSGIQDVQRSLSSLVGSLQSSQALQASTLVGRGVLVSGARATLAAGGTLAGAVDLASTTDRLRVTLLDPAGQPVRELDLGPQRAGLVHFQWDGRLDGGDPATPGSYVVRATTEVGGENVAAETLVASRVASVTLGRGGAGMQLNLEDGDSATLADVRELL